MGIIDWLLCDNTPDTSDLKNIKTENYLNIREDNQNMNNEEIDNKINDIDYIRKYNNKLLNEIESHFEEHTYKSSYKNEDFYICYAWYPNINWVQDSIYFVVVDKNKFKNIVNCKEQKIDRLNVFKKRFFKDSDIYTVEYDDKKLLKLNDLFSKLMEMIYSDIDIVKDVKKEINYFLEKTGKSYED